MSFESLKKYARAATEFEWCGQKILLRKFSAQDHLEIFGTAANAEQPTTPEADNAATVAFHINVIARTLVESDGALSISDESRRAWLRTEVEFGDLCELSQLALKHSGYGAEKKS